jgi:hypothetical protein
MIVAIRCPCPCCAYRWAIRRKSDDVEISDDLFERAQRMARKEKITFRSLTEQGLRLVLKEKQSKPAKLPPLVTVRGRGLTDEFTNAPWEKFRDEIYWGTVRDCA